MEQFRHIAVEGVPGSGKSAVAQSLAESLSARLALDVTENPFLDLYTRDMSQYAFQVQMYFLLMRHRADEELYQPDLFSRCVVSDYLFERDEIYASITLNADELGLYRRLFSLLVERRPEPDLVVYLRVSCDEALRRKPDLDPDYLRLVVGAYEDFFARCDRYPLLVVDADDFDPATRDADLDELLGAVSGHGGQGVNRLSRGKRT